MDDTLPDSQAILTPVPTFILAVEDQYKALSVADISHFVVQ
jgi:hypothetical protein